MYESTSAAPVPSPRPKSEFITTAVPPPRRTLPPPPPMPTIADTPSSSAHAPPRRPIPTIPEVAPVHKLAVPPKRTLPPSPTPPTTPPTSASDSSYYPKSPAVPPRTPSTSASTGTDRPIPSPPMTEARPTPAPRPVSTYSLGRSSTTSRPPSIASLTLPERSESPPPMPKIVLPPKKPVSTLPTPTVPQETATPAPEPIKRPISSVRAMAESLETQTPSSETSRRVLPPSAIKVMLEPTDRSTPAPPARPTPTAVPNHSTTAPPALQRSTTVPWKQKVLDAKALEPIPEPILTPVRRVPPPPPRSSTLPWKTKTEVTPEPPVAPARTRAPAVVPGEPAVEESHVAETHIPPKPRRFPTTPVPQPKATETHEQPPTLPSRPTLPARPKAPVTEEPQRQPSPERPSLPARPVLPQRPGVPQTQRPPQLPTTERPPPLPRTGRPALPQTERPPTLPQTDRPLLPQRPSLPSRTPRTEEPAAPAQAASTSPLPDSYAIVKSHSHAVTHEFNGERLNLKDVDFSYIDDHALGCPPSEEESLARLSYYLTSPFPGDQVAQLRAIFAWVGYNIKYDFKAAYGGGRRGDQSAVGVLRTKLSVCEGYANLFKALSDEQGLGVSMVSGDARGLGCKVGSDSLGEGHAWNKVTINGEHLLIDSTWGGAPNSSQDGQPIQQKRLASGYFLARPHRMIYSHWPRDPRDQCLDPPLPEHVYRVLPFRKMGSWSLGTNLHEDSFGHTRYTDNDFFEVQLRLKKPPAGSYLPTLNAKLKWTRTAQEDQAPIVWTGEDAKYTYMSVRSVCPTAGDGELNIYGIGFDPEFRGGYRGMDTVASLRIVNHGDGSNYRPTVTTFPSYNLLYSVEEPILSNIPADTTQAIRVHVYSVLPGGSLPKDLTIRKDGESQAVRAVGGFASMFGGGGGGDEGGGNCNTIPKTGPFTYELQRTFQPGAYKITFPMGMGAYGFLAEFDVV
ncbi:hypothetical protein BGZ83_011585 [Gryganskiella cystojenkinii]|nr:hypothetical protein BGZ83_011585 [Gryganskiella cystojenkinii]